MKIARIRLDTPDGPQARVVVAPAGSERFTDVRAHLRLSLERRGATAQAARELAAVIAPGSLAAALGNGEVFLDALRAASEDTSGLAAAPDGPLLAPVDPVAYRDFVAFEEHFVNAARASGGQPSPVLYELPISYIGSAQAFIGPEDTMPWPTYSERRMDYELELGIVVGSGGRNIMPEDAGSHILGLTVLNDFSARDMQFREMQGRLGPSKGKHFASSCGPVVVTLDDLDPRDLRMTARVNGEEWSRGNSGTILWSIEEIVAWASASEPLAAGTLLGSGTVGRGCGLELGRELCPGDTVELEIEGIGVLRNRVGHPDGRGWTPSARTPASPRPEPWAGPRT